MTSSAPPSSSSLPLSRLVALLPGDAERDVRWGARRQGERIPFCKPIAIKRSDHAENGELSAVEVEAFFEGWTLNVCAGGMRIITEEPLKVGDLVQVDVTSSGTPYTGKARIAWVRQEQDGIVAGLEFER